MHTGACSIVGCKATIVRARGLCDGHYQRLKRHGNPTAGRDMTRTPLDRFMEKIRVDGDCWIWTASTTRRDPNLYGIFWPGRGATVRAPRSPNGTPRPRAYAPMILAHRWSYQHFKGPILDGLKVCHTCDRPPCVNPAHLWLGTDSDNQQDAVAKGRMAYRKGEGNGRAKLTAADVASIRAEATGRYGEISELARKNGVASGTMSKILKHQIWTD